MLKKNLKAILTVEIQKILRSLSISEHPVGLGGCKSHSTTFECCEYNITVFDNQNTKPRIVEAGGSILKIQHGSLAETNPDILQKFEGMTVVLDEKWDLGMMLSGIEEKKDKIRRSCIKGCLIDAALCATKAKQNPHEQFAPAWVKCAAYFIADALVLHNKKQRSPTHMLEFIRRSKKSKANEFSIVAEAMGLERATPSLLERMAKSTIGFSDMTEGAGCSGIIRKKYEFLTANSLLTDCYFYLGYVNRDNFTLIRDSLHKKGDLVHVLKTALDFEHDSTKIEAQANALHRLSNELACSI